MECEYDFKAQIMILISPMSTKHSNCVVYTTYYVEFKATFFMGPTVQVQYSTVYSALLTR